jgi:hypothetical protein
VINPKFSNIFSCILKEIYIQENMMIIFRLSILGFKLPFFYNTIHFPFKEVVYILFLCIFVSSPTPCTIMQIEHNSDMKELNQYLTNPCNRTVL